MGKRFPLRTFHHPSGLLGFLRVIQNPSESLRTTKNTQALPGSFQNPLGFLRAPSGSFRIDEDRSQNPSGTLQGSLRFMRVLQNPSESRRTPKIPQDPSGSFRITQNPLGPHRTFQNS
eukprot:5192048-Pyramimonas_sp.AAC.1